MKFRIDSLALRPVSNSGPRRDDFSPGPKDTVPVTQSFVQ